MFDMAGEIWAAALVGAALPDILRIIKARHTDLPDWVGKIGFWVGFVLLLALGVFAVAITESQDPELTFVAALAIGYGAPDVISKLASKQGSTGTLQTAGEPSLRDWWAR